MYFHQWSDVTRRAIFFSFSSFLSRATSLARHSAVSFHSEVQQIALSPFFFSFFSLDSLICPPFARPLPHQRAYLTLLQAPAFQRSTPVPLCRLHVSAACPFQDVLTRTRRGYARLARERGCG